MIASPGKDQQYLLVEKDNGLAPFIPWVSMSSETDEIISASKFVASDLEYDSVWRAEGDAIKMQQFKRQIQNRNDWT